MGIPLRDRGIAYRCSKKNSSLDSGQQCQLLQRLANDGKEKSLNLAVLCHCVSLTGYFTGEKGQTEVLSITHTEATCID